MALAQYNSPRLSTHVGVILVSILNSRSSCAPLFRVFIVKIHKDLIHIICVKWLNLPHRLRVCNNEIWNHIRPRYIWREEYKSMLSLCLHKTILKVLKQTSKRKLKYWILQSLFTVACRVGLGIVSRICFASFYMQEQNDSVDFRSSYST